MSFFEISSPYFSITSLLSGILSSSLCFSHPSCWLIFPLATPVHEVSPAMFLTLEKSPQSNIFKRGCFRQTYINVVCLSLTLYSSKKWQWIWSYSQTRSGSTATLFCHCGADPHPLRTHMPGGRLDILWRELKHLTKACPWMESHFICSQNIT